MKVVISLQKDILINQCDPCTRLYILRSGSLQAAASDKLLQSFAAHQKDQRSERSTTSKARSSTWKAKMQVQALCHRPAPPRCQSPRFRHVVHPVVRPWTRVARSCT